MYVSAEEVLQLDVQIMEDILNTRKATRQLLQQQTRDGSGGHEGGGPSKKKTRNENISFADKDKQGREHLQQLGIQLAAAQEEKHTLNEAAIMSAEKLAATERKLGTTQNNFHSVVTAKYGEVIHPQAVEEVRRAMYIDVEVFCSVLECKVGQDCLTLVAETNDNMMERLLEFRANILEWLPNCHGSYLKSAQILSGDCLAYIYEWVRGEANRLKKSKKGMYTYDNAFRELWRITFDDCPTVEGKLTCHRFICMT
jgi:hypothetical protein